MSHSARLATSKIFLDAIKEKKEDAKAEGREKFILHADGKIVFCPICIAEDGDDAMPLAYPSVRICITAPTPALGYVGKQKTITWRWEHDHYCIPHAMCVLAAIMPSDIMPKKIPEERKETETTDNG